MWTLKEIAICGLIAWFLSSVIAVVRFEFYRRSDRRRLSYTGTANRRTATADRRGTYPK
jgi:hypothetical protein